MTTESTDIESQVQTAIADHEVVCFIKGTPERPQCGFSQRAIGFVSEHRESFETVNVLDELPAYRAALEDHSGWETIPQVYVDGEFVGGSDVLQELAEQGDLDETLNAAD
ncbi:MAG: glutaredoxin family protein [Halococcoides sp.]